MLAVNLTNNATGLYRTTNGALIRTFQGTGSPAFSPDGTSIALVSSNRIKLWALADGHEIQTLSGSTNATLLLAYSPDGRTLAAGFGGSPANLIQRWEMPSGKPLVSIQTHFSYGQCLAFSPDGRFLAAADYAGVLGVWDASTGALIYQFDPEPERIGHTIYSLAFSADSKFVAGATLGGNTIPEFGDAPALVKVWNLENGSFVRAYTNDRPHGAGTIFSFRTVAFSPDNKILMAGSDDNSIFIWRIADGALLGTYSANDIIFSVTFSADLKHFAYAKDYHQFGVANNPLWVSSIRITNQSAIIQWQGGNGLYQLQYSTNLTNSQWQNLGSPTSLRAFTNATSPLRFYRVQAVGAP